MKDVIVVGALQALPKKQGVDFIKATAILISLY